MDKAALVSVDIETGAEVLRALDHAKAAALAALWVYLPEYEDWRLVIAGRRFDSRDPREAYKLLYDSLSAGGFKLARTPPVMIMPTTDPFIKTLRRIFGRTRNVEGMRLGGQMIGDRFVEDAYVYRVA